MPSLLVTPAKQQSPAPTNGWQKFWAPFWVMPMLIIALCFAAGVLLPMVDKQVAHALPIEFSSGPDAARSVLGAIASAMISVTGVVFSTTLVVLQLASSQFSPLVLRTFLDMRISQITLGLFMGTFLYSLTVLRSIRSSNDVDVVPQVSSGIAYLLVLACVVCFVAFIHYITTSIQVTQAIAHLGERTREMMTRHFLSEAEIAEMDGSHVADVDPQHMAPFPIVNARIIHAENHGVVAQVDYAALMKLAEESDAIVELLVQHGEFCPTGADLIRWMPHTPARAHGASPEEFDESKARNAVVLKKARTHPFDPAFGVRQISDIAARALSSGMNDPTTAIQCLHELEDVLAIAVARLDRAPYFEDSKGLHRVWWKPQKAAQLLIAAYESAIHYSQNDPAVLDQIVESLDHLLRVTREENAPILRDLKERALLHRGELAAGSR